MSTYLNFGRDVQGHNTYASQFAINIFSATLAAGAASSVVVPLDALSYIMYVRCEPTGYVWARRTGTAAVPAGSTFAASNSELICGTIEYKKVVYPGDTISFITPNTTCNIMVEFFAVGYP